MGRSKQGNEIPVHREYTFHKRSSKKPPLGHFWSWGKLIPETLGTKLHLVQWLLLIFFFCKPKCWCSDSITQACSLIEIAAHFTRYMYKQVRLLNYTIGEDFFLNSYVNQKSLTIVKSEYCILN